MVTSRFVFRAALPVLVAALTGCGSLSLPSLDGFTPGAAPVTASAPPKAEPEAVRSTASFSLSSLRGVPNEKMDDLTRALDRAASDAGLSFFNFPGSETETDYLLFGYFLPSTKKGEDEVTYVWDLMDRSGKRVGRASGSARVQNGLAGAPGGLLTPDVLKTVSEDAVAQILAASRSPQVQVAASPLPGASPPQVQQVVARR